MPHNMFQTVMTPDLEALWLQIDLAQSSSGVGWANGYCHILTFARTSRLAGFWARGKPLDMISRGSAVFFPVLKHRDIPPCDLLCAEI